MIANRLLTFVAAATVAAFLAGCGKEPEPVAASPTCAELDKVTDPAQRAELLKKCPRSGPEFKASPKKEY